MAEFTCYIDESGDEGFNFEKGSLEWHVIAGVLIRTREREQVVSAITDYRNALYKNGVAQSAKAPHWYKLKDGARHLYAKTINSRNIKLFVVAIWKTRLHRAEWINQSGHLYRYGLKLLAERTSWYASRHNGDLQFVFARSQSATIREIRRELASAMRNKRRWDVRSVFDINGLEVSTPDEDNMLCFADATASAFGNALNPSREGKNKGLLKPAYSAHFVPNLCYGLKDSREHKVKIFPDRWLLWWHFMGIYRHAIDWF